MPSWHSILEDIRRRGSVHDVIRREYLAKLHEVTGRNVIVYYSGWLQKPGLPGIHVNDADKNGFMTAIHQLDRSKGLDLLLHTPGGETAATESLVDYLHSMFGPNIRAIVPQIALSAGTMIACATREILMGKHSSLGPIDPQFGPTPAHGIIEEFKRAHAEIKADPSKIPVWQPIIAKYSPTLIGECEKAIKWSIDMTRDWLLRVMHEQGRDVHVVVEVERLALARVRAGFGGDDGDRRAGDCVAPRRLRAKGPLGLAERARWPRDHVPGRSCAVRRSAGALRAAGHGLTPGAAGQD